MKLKIEYMNTADLRPYANNAKIHSAEQIEQIKKSIQDFGMNDPIAIWKDNEIIEGHGRLIACMELGVDPVPVIKLDNLTDEQRRAYMLVHNQLTMNTGFDSELLQMELEKLADIDMSAFGLELEEEKEDPDDVIEDDYNAETATPEKKAKPGDLFRLGEHRLLCGDATDKEAQEKLFDGVRPRFVFTDPPYGVAIGDKNKLLNEHVGASSIDENIYGDTMGKQELHDMLTTALRNLKAACADDCSYYVTAPQGGDLGLMMLQMMRDAGLEVKHNLVWVKNAATFSMGRLDYEYRHEPIFYTWGAKHNFYGDYATTVIDDMDDIDGMSKAELKEALRAYREAKQTSVVYCDKPRACDLHPTMKPLKLIARFMVNSSRPGDPAADIFGGSGSTLITAEQLARPCYMMEIDPHYCDVIIDRWEKFTGEKAELIND